MVASFDTCKDDVRADVEICRRTRRTDGARGVQIANRRPDGLSGRDIPLQRVRSLFRRLEALLTSPSTPQPLGRNHRSALTSEQAHDMNGPPSILRKTAAVGRQLPS